MYRLYTLVFCSLYRDIQLHMLISMRSYQCLLVWSDMESLQIIKMWRYVRLELRGLHNITRRDWWLPCIYRKWSLIEDRLMKESWIIDQLCGTVLIWVSESKYWLCLYEKLVRWQVIITRSLVWIISRWSLLRQSNQNLIIYHMYYISIDYIVKVSALNWKNPWYSIHSS